MARARTGLADDELATAVAAVAAGKRPRVALPAQQFGGATTGTIVAIGDPAVEGEEFISVRVKLDGIADTLRFGPAELTVPARALRTRAAAQKMTPTAATPMAARSVTASSATPPTTPAAATSATPRKRASSRPKSDPVTPGPATTPREAVPRATSPATRKPAGRRSLPTVTFTVSSSGTAWTLTANRGGRAVVRATPVPAGVVTAVAELLAELALRTAVDDVNGSALREAQERAEQLRRELAAVESLLESHHRPG